jgi:hypothetical protein
MRVQTFRGIDIKALWTSYWEWRKFHNEEPPSLYSSPNIIRERRMRWTKYVVNVAYRDKRAAFRLVILKGRDCLINFGVDIMIILKCILDD